MEDDRPAPNEEIEVTPDMIEAGVDVFVTIDGRFESPEEAVEDLPRYGFCFAFTVSEASRAHV